MIIREFIKQEGDAYADGQHKNSTGARIFREQLGLLRGEENM